jgi:hypothetical protein
MIAGLGLILAAAIHSATQQRPRAARGSGGDRILFIAQVAEQPNRLDSNHER